ncbi:MAG: hypothetical protein FWC03_06370 [Treponema sp.]|nr:hypothetical protein [Treponema sp.]
MKAQFKYAFLAGLYFRGYAFAVIFIMNTVFILLGSIGVLPFAASVTAVSLGGVAIAIMLAANIGGDIAIARRMFSAPIAYLHALTPVPRWKTLLAGIIAMAVMDIITMTYVIVTEVWLSFNLAGGGYWQTVWNYLGTLDSSLLMTLVLWIPLAALAYYLLTIMIIMFSVTARKSFLCNLPASGLLAFLLACACFYVISLLQLVLAPFSDVQRYLFFIIITPGSNVALPLLVILTLLETTGIFILTSKLIERKINL